MTYKIKLIEDESEAHAVILRNKKGGTRTPLGLEDDSSVPIYTLEEFTYTYDILSYNQFSNVIVSTDKYREQLLSFVDGAGFIPLLLKINEDEWIYAIDAKELSGQDDAFFSHYLSKLDSRSEKYFLSDKIDAKTADMIEPYLKDDDIKEKLFSHREFLEEDDGKAVVSFLENSGRKHLINGGTKNEVAHILDWIRSTHKKDNAMIDKDLSKASWDFLSQKVKDWMQKLEKENKGLKDGPGDIKFIANVDGYRLVHLLTPEAKDRESGFMGHCVGGGNYDDHNGIYSIRDSDNEPHATLEIVDSVALQIKGKGNNPVVPKYHMAVGEALIAIGVDEIEEDELDNCGLTAIPKKCRKLFTSGLILKGKYAFTSAKLDEDLTKKAILEDVGLLKGLTPFKEMDRILHPIIQKICEDGLIKGLIHRLCKHGHTESALALSNIYPEALNMKEKYGHTPLHMAVSGGHTETAMAIAKLYPDAIKIKDREGDAPLYSAARYGHMELAIALAKLSPEALNMKEKNGSTPLYWAARYGHTELAIALAKLSPEAVNKKDKNGHTPLHWVAWAGRTELAIAIAKICPEALNITDRSGRTPLDIAVSKGHTETADALKALMEELGMKV